MHESCGYAFIYGFMCACQAQIPMSVHLAMAMLKFYSEFRRQYIGNAEASARALSIQRDMDV